MNAEIRNRLSLWSLGDEYNKEDTRVLFGNEFSLLPRKHDRISPGTIHKMIILFFLMSLLLS